MKCVKCGKTRDTRLGWCFPCASKPKGATMAKKKRLPPRRKDGTFRKRKKR